MKLARSEASQFGPEVQRLRDELEVLLALWVPSEVWRWHRHRASQFASPEHAATWKRFVIEARAIPPASVIEGLEAAIRWRNEDRLGEEPWSVSSVVASGVAKVVGRRVGLRSPVGTQHEPLLHGRDWTLAAPCDEVDYERFRDACDPFFAQLAHVEGHFIASEVRDVVPASAIILGHATVGVQDGGLLFATWQKAAALHVARAWIAGLDPLQRSTLAAEALRRVEVDAPDLAWPVDIALYEHRERWHEAPARPAFATRLDELFWARGHLETNFSSRSLGPASESEAMADAVVHAGTPCQVGSLLVALPPGRTHAHAVRTVRTCRPEIIADLLWHPSFSLEGMFAISDWPDTLVQLGDRNLSMKDEWAEVMRLARRLVVFPSREPDVGAGLALLVHDEVMAESARKSPYVRTAVPVLATRTAPWRELLRADAHARIAVEALTARLQLGATEADYVVALRILEIIGGDHPVHARQLAVATVESYLGKLAVGAGSRCDEPRLEDHGELLAVLDRVLLATAPDVRERWLAPFDPATLVAWSSGVTPGADAVPAFAATRAVVTHAGHLVAAALASDASDREALLRAFVVLFEGTCSRMQADPWGSGRWSHEEHWPPLLVQFGRGIRLLPEPLADEFLDRVVQAGAKELHMAELLWGIEPTSGLGARIAGRVRRGARAPLRSGVSYGESAWLAIALVNAGMPELAEPYASWMVEVTRGDPVATSLRPEAVRLLFTTWAAQQKWNEIEEADLGFSGPAPDFIENFRALAALERGRPDEALERIERLLRRMPNDETALTNRVAVLAARQDWVTCLRAFDEARQKLGSKLPAEGYLQAAQAHYELGDPVRAARTLEELPSGLPAGMAAEVLKLRVALAVTTDPSFESLREDLDELRRTDPATADYLRSRLAPLTRLELGAGWTSSGQRKTASFEERCAFLDESPHEYLLRKLAWAALKIAEQPPLARNLNEDQLTRLLCAYLGGLEVMHVYAHPYAQVGWARTAEGLADFALAEMSVRLGHGRRLVLGEAKVWDGAAWMASGMRQVFGTGNTGSELFLVLVIYSKERDFEATVRKAVETLAAFGEENVRSPYRLDEAPEAVRPIDGDAVRVLRTKHRKEPGNPRSPVRTLYTLIVDVLSEASRQIRRKEPPNKPSAKSSDRKVAPKKLKPIKGGAQKREVASKKPKPSKAEPRLPKRRTRTTRR